MIGGIIVGALAGWLASTYMKGESFGLFWNLILGLSGAIVGKVVFWLIGFAAVGFFASTFQAALGAVILLYIIPKLNSKT